MMRRVLVVRACAVGDFVLNLPALKALQDSLGNAVFTLVGYPSTLALAREFVPVEAVHSIESPPWSALFSRPAPEMEFDSAFVWMKDPDFAERLRASGVTDVFRADPFPRFGHAADHLLRTLKQPRPPLPDLWACQNDEIILHPGSGSPRKCWPYFPDLAAELKTATILFGPAETLWAAPRAVHNLPLQEVSRRLRACRAYIGNDSGITHLAAYLGCPTLALFGPSDPRVWGPVGRRSRVIWKRRLEDISVRDVLRWSTLAR